MSVTEPISQTNQARAFPKGHIPALDGLRGFAIIAVVLFHIDLFLGPVASGYIPGLYHNVARFGWSGVDLFFVLSGFLITGILYDTAKRPRYFRTFYFRRALRIFPLYYFFLICFFALGPAFLIATGHAPLVQSHIRPSTQRYAWLYMVNWFGGLRTIDYFPQFIQHFWSLSVEEQFYLFWPFVVYSFARAGLKRLCVALVALSLVSRLVLLFGGLDAAAYTWTICRMDGMAIGGFVALCARDPHDWKALERWAIPVAWSCFGVFVMLAVASLQLPIAIFYIDAFGATLLTLLSGACLVLALSPSPNLVRLVGSFSFLRVAGKYSYGAYVWHQPLLISLRASGFRADRLLGVLHNEWLTLVVATAVPLALAAIAAFGSWHLLEKRFLQLRERPSTNRFGAVGRTEPAEIATVG